METLSERLSFLIKSANTNDSKFAELIGIPKSSISKYKKNGNYLPGFETILVILEKFPNLNARWFITGDGNPWLVESDNMLSDISAQYLAKDTPSISELIQNQLSTIKSDEIMDKELVSRLVSLIEKQQNDIHLSLEIQHNLVSSLSFLGEQKKVSGSTR